MEDQTGVFISEIWIMVTQSSSGKGAGTELCTEGGQQQWSEAS